MPVMPEKAEATRVYPKDKKDGERALGVIDVDRIYKMFKNMVSAQKKDDEPEKVPQRKLEYERSIPELPAGYKFRGEGSDAMTAFYGSLSKKLGGIPIYEVSYDFMKNRNRSEVPDNRYVTGLFDIDSNGERIFISKTDDTGTPFSTKEKMKIAYHEASEASWYRLYKSRGTDFKKMNEFHSEREIQERAAGIAFSDGNVSIARELIDSLATDEYFKN